MKFKAGKYQYQMSIGLCAMWHSNDHVDIIIDFLWWYLEITIGKAGVK